MMERARWRKGDELGNIFEKDDGGLNWSHGTEDGRDQLDGPENQLGGRKNRQVSIWMSEQRVKVDALLGTGYGRSSHVGCWVCEDEMTSSDLCALRV